MDAVNPPLLTMSDFLPEESKCAVVLAGLRWRDGVVCPSCGSTQVKKNGRENGRQRYFCHSHQGTFSDTTGTIFEYSKVGLGAWYYFIFHYQRNSSTKSLSEVLGVSYKTALRMAHLVQDCVNGKCSGIRLSGEVEFDELYLSCGAKGLRDLDRPPRRRGLKLRGRGTLDDDKPPILGACDRLGHLRLKVADHANTDWIAPFFLGVMAKISSMVGVYTDEFTSYRFLRHSWVKHATVNHSTREYSRGSVHNNTMEGYWSIFRHWMNTYRGVNKKYLSKYTAFFEFVENHRSNGWVNLLHTIIFFYRLPHWTPKQAFNTHHLLNLHTKSLTATISFT